MKRRDLVTGICLAVGSSIFPDAQKLKCGGLWSRLAIY